jgi:hypothetical protein
MTYLPQLRTSLVKAAGQRYGDAPEPQRRRRTPRWLTRGSLATALAGATAIAVAAVALVALGSHQTRTPAASSTAVTRATLGQAASHALDRLALPPGAVVSGLVRGTPIELWSPSNRLAIANHVDVYRVWRLRQSPGRVMAFIEAHRPAGSSLGVGTEASSAANGGPAKVQAATVEINFSATRSGIWRQLAVDIVSLDGGVTALRVDSEAGWVMPRPKSDLIPAGVTRVELEWRLRTGAHHGLVTVTKPQRVKALVSLFNSLPSAQRGTGLCKRAPYGFIRFAFEAGQGTPPLALATWAPPCQNLGLEINGGPSSPVRAGAPTLPPGAEVGEVFATVLAGGRLAASLGVGGGTGNAAAERSVHVPSLRATHTAVHHQRLVSPNS